MTLSYRSTSPELPNRGAYFLEGEYLRAKATTKTSENPLKGKFREHPPSRTLVNKGKSPCHGSQASTE
jgi:hypothetical protein